MKYSYTFADSRPLSSVAAKLSKRRIRKNIRNTKRIRKYKRKKNQKKHTLINKYSFCYEKL